MWIKKSATIITISITISTVIFAIGEKFSWWDYVTKRKYALEGLERLWSAEGYPTSWIYINKKNDKKGKRQSGSFNGLRNKR